MSAFKFTFNINKKLRGKAKERITSPFKYTTIESHCEGLVVENSKGIYCVSYKDKEYEITEKSYECKGKKNVYARFRDERNHRIRIIRDKLSKCKMDKRFYIPFAIGLMAKGRLVKNSTGDIKFHITSCYNIDDMNMMSDAFKEHYDENSE